MAASRANQDALLATLFPRVVSKAERRKIQILEAAIACYASLGVENTTYEAIAAKCKASRTLVIHYFPRHDELIGLVFQFIRADMQNAAVDEIKKARSPEKRLPLYIQSTFDWVQKKPVYWTVWMLLFYYSGVRREFKAMHSSLTAMGHERILNMVSELPENRETETGILSLRAKTLQALITGSLITVHAETLPMKRSAFIAQTIEDCLRIAKG